MLQLNVVGDGWRLGSWLGSGGIDDERDEVGELWRLGMSVGRMLEAVVKDTCRRGCGAWQVSGGRW